MRNGNYRTLLLVTLFITAVIVGSFGRHAALNPAMAQTQETRKTQRWEYCYMSAPYSTNDGWKVRVSRGGDQEIRDSDQTGAAALNKLGLDGWELVGSGGEVVNQGNQTFTHFFLKRPK